MESACDVFFRYFFSRCVFPILTCERCKKTGHLAKRCPKRKIIRRVRDGKPSRQRPVSLKSLESINEARKLYKEDIGVQHIAKMLGVSTPTICIWTRDLIKARRQEKLKEDQILRKEVKVLRKKGLSIPKIAKILNIGQAKTYYLDGKS